MIVSVDRIRKEAEKLFGQKGSRFHKTPGEGKGIDELTGEIFKVAMKRIHGCDFKLSYLSYFKLYSRDSTVICTRTTLISIEMLEMNVNDSVGSKGSPIQFMMDILDILELQAHRLFSQSMMGV